LVACPTGWRWGTVVQPFASRPKVAPAVAVRADGRTDENGSVEHGERVEPGSVGKPSARCCEELVSECKPGGGDLSDRLGVGVPVAQWCREKLEVETDERRGLVCGQNHPEP